MSEPEAHRTEQNRTERDQIRNIEVRRTSINYVEQFNSSMKGQLKGRSSSSSVEESLGLSSGT
jgi:hypothetical protein